jgi:hypothetical protein
MPSNRQWAEAMSDRLWEGISSEYDQRTKDLIVQAFLGGLAEYPQLLENLKSSSLIESNYFDNEFPYATIQLNTAGYRNDILSPWNHPNYDLVIKSLEKAKQTKCYYHQERGAKPIVDGLYEHYIKQPKFNLEKLSNFCN